jgi:hypothetical protein
MLLQCSCIIYITKKMIQLLFITATSRNLKSDAIAQVHQ